MYTRRKPLSLAGARLPQTRNGLEKSGERAGDTRTHRGQRERLQEEEEEREGMGEVYTARFVMSKSIVLAVLAVESLISKWGGLVSPSCFADVGRFNPPG